MDAMGSADELGHDEPAPAPHHPLVTSEALAVTGVLLVVISVLSGNLWQFLAFVLVNQTSSQSPAWQFAMYTGPSGLIAAGGIACGLRAARDTHLAPWGRSLAGAAVLTGAVIVAFVVVGVVAGFIFGQPAL